MIIPGLVRGTDPTLPRQVLEARLKVIDKRRAAIELTLQIDPDRTSYQSQELEAERRELGDMRTEVEAALRPASSPARPPHLEGMYRRQRESDIAFLRIAIRHEREHIEHAAEREATAGNHRAARLHRLGLPTVPEMICKQFGKDLALLSEIE
jgi:hypothetical protein